jgi:hypothetical protein
MSSGVRSLTSPQQKMQHRGRNMRAWRRGVGLLALAVLALPAAARADELLVMPYACTMEGRQPVLTPGPDQGHRIIGPREQRKFSACSQVNAGMCQQWTVQRFDLDCDGARVPWVSVVAATNEGRRNAWLLDGRLVLRMGPKWSLPPDDPCASEPDEDNRAGYRRMRRYCADQLATAPPAVVEMPFGYAPMFGIQGIFVQAAPGVGSAPPPLPPIAAAAPPPPARSAASEPLQGLFSAAPPVSEPAREPPSMAKRSPPHPQPAGQPPSPPKVAAPPARPATVPPAPKAASAAPASALAAAESPKAAPPEAKPAPRGPNLGPRLIAPNPPAKAAPAAPVAKAAATGPSGDNVAVSGATSVPKAAASPSPSSSAQPEGGTAGISLLSVFRATTTGALVAFAGLALGLLSAFALARRREQAEDARRRPRDLSAVSLDGRRGKPQVRSGSAGGAVAPAATAQMPAPSGSAGALAKWGDRMPHTRAEALQVLGIGVAPSATEAAIKKVVDGLRQSWHPDMAKDEADRALRELRCKQINVAWDLLRGQRAEV